MKHYNIPIYFIIFLSLVYFVSQFNRASLGAIPELLVKEFLINDEQLGRLGGAFFLSFALIQIPIGILLDKFEPMKIIFVMLLFILFGSFCISSSTSYNMLFLGRILQGIGCGVCLMGPLVIIARHVDKRRFSEYSGYVMGIGGLGALVATQPFFLIATELGWRDSFFYSACFIFILIIFSIFFIFSNKKKIISSSKKKSFDLNSYILIFNNKNFLLMLPMSIFGYASFAFLLTLWGNRYLTEIQNLKEEEASQILMVMALFWTLGSIFYGYLEKVFRKKNIVICSTVLIVFFLIILSIEKNLSTLNNYIIFSLLGFIGAYTLIVISHYRALFEENIIGKVLTAANLFNFGGVFFVQWLTGFIIFICLEKFKYDKDLGYSVALIMMAIFLAIAIFFYAKTDNEV